MFKYKIFITPHVIPMAVNLIIENYGNNLVLIARLFMHLHMQLNEMTIRKLNFRMR